MIGNRMNACFFCLLALIALGTLSGCTKPPEPMREAPVAEQPLPPAPPTGPTAQQPAPPIPPPTLAEARAAVARIYKDVVSVDASRKPSFIDGDFNGDGSQDLAVVVTPAKDKLADINSDVAGWMIRDALADSAPAPRMKLNPHEKTRATINESDQSLLVILHGSGLAGWRDPAAQQTFLIKNAVGSNFSVQTKKDLRAASQGKMLPPLLGDVLNQMLAGSAGFIYYTGSSYGWYDPRSEQVAVAKRNPH
jgi:hypothetical protein